MTASPKSPESIFVGLVVTKVDREIPGRAAPAVFRYPAPPFLNVQYRFSLVPLDGRVDFDHLFPPVYVQAPVSEIGSEDGAGGPEKPGGGGRLQHPVVEAEGKSLVLEVSSRVPGQRPVQVGREAVDSFSEPPSPGVYPGFFPGMEADFQAVVPRLNHSGKTGFAFQIGETPSADDGQAHAGKGGEGFKQASIAAGKNGPVGVGRDRGQGSVEVQEEENLVGAAASPKDRLQMGEKVRRISDGSAHGPAVFKAGDLPGSAVTAG